MWDRFKGAVPQKLGGRSQQHQQHAHHGPDKNAYGGGGGYSYRVQGGPPPPRPPREFEQPLQHFYDNSASGIEQVPVQSQHLSHAYRNSGASNRRPASSIYSQPSPIHTSFAPSSTAPPRRSYTFNDGDEISPPSSPEEITPRHGALPVPDISPIDEDDETYIGRMSQQQSFAQSVRGNISSLRRERRQKMDAANSQLRESKSRDRMRLQTPQPKPSELSKRGYHGGEVRWDPATGELTSSEKGRPSQVKPAAYAKEFGDSPPRAPMGSTTAPAISTSTSLGERVRRIAPPGFATGGAEKTLRAPATQTPPRRTPSPMSSPTAFDPAADAFTSDRPEWKGGSGRSAIVKPVRDTPDVAPLKIPRKSAKRGVASPVDTASPVATALSTVMASPPASPLTTETQQSPRETIRKIAPSSQLPPTEDENDQSTISPANYPSPPHSGGQHRALEDTATTSPNPMYSQSPGSTTPTSAVRRKPTPSQLSLHQQQSSISSAQSQSDPYNYATYAAANPLPNANPSTYNVGTPDEWAYSSPRSPETTYDLTGAPLTLGDGYGEKGSPSRDGGVMDRRRPKLREGGSGSTTPSSEDEPIKISLGSGQWANRDRKPLGLAAVANKPSSTHDDDYARRGSMAGSIHKNLPPAPPETTATDRVDQLNAQLRGLANRRLNLTRCIKQMTELMPTDNIMASADVLHKREVERRKVEALKMDLAEVQREEYDLGIKLHRAYKRIDRSGEYEPTTLWVRRVTGY